MTEKSPSFIYRPGVGPLNLLLHGLQGTKELFEPLIRDARFAARPFLSLDLPGFGGSRDLSDFDFTVAAYAEFIEGFLRERGDFEIVLIGHSLGGMIGSRLLRSEGIKSRALVSLEGNLTLSDCGASREIAALKEYEFLTKYLPQMIEKLASSTDPSAKSRHAAVLKANPRALYRASCSIVDESEREELLDYLTTASCPTLLLVGEKSSFSTRSIKGGVKIVTVPDAEHFLMSDNPGFVTGAIFEFLTEAGIR